MNDTAAAQTGCNYRPSRAAIELTHHQLIREIDSTGQSAVSNLEWLHRNMPPYFFITMKEEKQALKNLAWLMSQVDCQRRVVLDDQPDRLTVARLDRPGSIYDTLMKLRHRDISYAEMTHSVAPLPESDRHLEIQRLEFDPKDEQALDGKRPVIPPGLRKAVAGAMRNCHPDFDMRELSGLLGMLALNNPAYVRISPPERIARGLWMYQRAVNNGGLFVHIEQAGDSSPDRENRLLFAMIDPPQHGVLAQVSEIFQRLDVGVRRLYCLGLNTGEHTAMLGTYYVVARNGQPIEAGSDLYEEIRAELVNTSLLSNTCPVYNRFIGRRIMSGEDSSLVNAFIAFCHTSLAHWQPDRFDREAVRNAFCAHPDIAREFVGLFRLRFDPAAARDEAAWSGALNGVERTIADYNTGHRNLDGIRKTIFRTCLLFIKHTLKTNFFVREKQALAFRLDPAYLAEMGPECSADLPAGQPFRITFFLARDGFGYHIGFSDIARGGWRTIISTTDDEFTTNTDSLFKENYVLAHTQHLKNKDIYEGGSKMVVVMDARNCDSRSKTVRTLHDLQRSILGAFLDVFTTENGRAKDPAVVDYYADDEPIELGPDENMGDQMIEHIARQAVAREYVLGVGLISSKRQGINHKEYGVTSLGVVKTAIIAMTEMGLDPERRPFTVNFTGGPSGDVAGNAMRRLLDNHPMARIIGVTDGPGILHDPAGVDPDELRRLTLREDITVFEPEKLHPGGYIAYRLQRRRENLRNLHRMVVRTEVGIQEKWISADEYQRRAQELTFALECDLFLPCGGRPETIDDSNWTGMIGPDGRPSVKLIVEGANSFITPKARTRLQEEGVTILRDATANKCGVIASSYEIIANLLMSDREFKIHKQQYVSDVLDILGLRAAEETALIFKRRRQSDDQRLFTDISADISLEINGRYAELFQLFQERPDLVESPLYRKVVLNHLPAIIGSHRKYRSRLVDLPQKVKCAILASELASMITYRGGWEGDLAARVTGFLKETID